MNKRPPKSKKAKPKRQPFSLRRRVWLKRQNQKLQKSTTIKQLHKLAGKPKFAKSYLVTCLIILFATTSLWAVVGALLQQGNADQLINTYLFQDSATFHGALLPDQHSFLIKWPIFLAVRLFGFNTASFVTMTLLIVLLTVAGLVYVLSRIEKRPIILGTLCLALASVLLLVPAQPYAGGLLPVNMAMLATRNLEYIFYIAGLYCVAKAPRIRSKYFLGAALLLGLLIASDKLFLSVSLAGGALALICYTLAKRWESSSLSARLLLAGVGAGLVGIILKGLINHLGVTRIVSLASVGPYGLAHGLKALSLGVIYAAGGFMTNFGANPAYDALTLRAIPSRAVHNMLSLAGPAYLINFAVLAFGLTVCVLILLRSVGLFKQPKLEISATATGLSLMLLWGTVAVIGLFIVTNHYYVVDARYLTLGLFAVFVSLAVWTSGQRLKPELWLLCAPVLVFSIVCSSLALGINKAPRQAATSVAQRNQLIAQTIASHRVDVLVGDYWRVIPTKLSADNNQLVVPLSGCTTNRQILTSTKWQPDLHKHSFAYLLTLEGSATDYPNCTFQQVEKGYGLPNSSALIDGTLSHPKEQLLFYDRGIHQAHSGPITKLKSATVLPVDLSEINHTSCSVPTIMNVVAHQDDDLLFMNPDIYHDIQAGHCIRTVYLTAGDAGADAPYWLSREKGSEAAYSLMTGSKSIWIQRIVKLPNGQFVTIDSPKGNNNISLIFMHLPDGNLRGEGFGASHNESLSSLEAGRIPNIETVDHQSTYDISQLAGALVALMHAYQPAEVRTQSDYAGTHYTDHSDHLAAGKITVKAFRDYETQQYAGYLTVPLKFYEGYPIRQSGSNVSGQDLQNKEAIFMAYAAFDGSVCHSVEQCHHTPTYGSYLDRQYTNPR